MIIEDGILTKVYETDIVNGTCRIPEGVTSIGDFAFAWCGNLESITLPEGVISIGDCAFEGCESLKNIHIPESVTWIGACAFQGCKSLENVNIPEEVTFIGVFAFYGCESLEDISLLDSVTHINKGVFSNCRSLRNVNIPEGIPYIDVYAFRGCENLKSVVLPDSLSYIDYCAFQGCENLKNIDIPESVTWISSFAFEYCESLESVVLPQSFDVNQRAFVDCDNLKTVMFRDKVPESLVKDGALTDKAKTCFGPDVTITAVPSAEKAAEQPTEQPKKSLSERLADKLEEKSRANKSDKVASNEKAVVRIPESNIRALPDQPGRSYASIGLNSEHGTYGSIYFSDKALKTPRKEPDVRLLYLNPDKSYNVAFADPDTGNWEYHNMTGKEIFDGNKAYLKERGLLKKEARSLPSVADNMQAPQSDMQFEG